MSEYEDLMNLSGAKLAEASSLMQTSEAYKRSAEATLAKGHELRRQAEDIKAREQKKDEFIPGEFVVTKNLYLGVYVGGSTHPDYPHRIRFWGAIHSCKECRLPKDEEGVFIRHVGNDCPVSDRNAELIVLYTDGNIGRAAASDYYWHNNAIMGYVIIPKWALERVK